MADRFGVKLITDAGLAQFRAERNDRTLYLFDVRSTDEHRKSHLRGAVSAPGGQLVQATDTFVGVRNARIVLIDDDGVRARMTASWLKQMGAGEVYVLDGWDPTQQESAQDDSHEELGFEGPEVDLIQPKALAAALERVQAIVVDLDTSLNFRRAHIPEAWWAVRSRLAATLPKLPAAQMVVLRSADGRLACLAAPEAARLVPGAVKVLAGGTEAWQSSGLPLESGDARLADTPDDVWYKPYHQQSGVEDAMKKYLSWEVGLLAQLERDQDAAFRIPQ